MLTQIGCPIPDVCVGLDDHGRALVADPQTDTTWTVTPIAGISRITDITCPSTSLCIAVDRRGHAATATISTS